MATTVSQPNITTTSDRLFSWSLLKQTFAQWRAHKAARLGAALAYYTIFALPSLLVIAIAIAGLVFDPDDVREQLNAQLQTLLGKEGREAVEAMVAGAQHKDAGLSAAIVGT